ncbi:OLC1v1036858C1 [Oldenlandia corymbosa var. corymbosa]|uniref:OLC1v1036858C1 n=1 Tax=Oldenlandia corymbosa var. corymbosa TaxID=529605 RepID=A0AAV1CWE1_OLDCO|nr:OLC1v1036858C1 [Oldenlandia corymbosa var. corymbosa]
MVIERRLSYNKLVGRRCERFGWDREIGKPSMSQLFDSTGNGLRHYGAIKHKPSLEVLYYLPRMSCIDLYVGSKDIIHSGRVWNQIDKMQGMSRDGPYFENLANTDYKENGTDLNDEKCSSGSYHLDAETSQGGLMFENPVNENYMEDADYKIER